MEDLSNIKGGSTVWVEYRDTIESKRFKTFTGICLSNSKKGADNVLVLRTMVGDIGVEYGFHTASKNIKNITVVKKNINNKGRVKRFDLRKETR